MTGTKSKKEIQKYNREYYKKNKDRLQAAYKTKHICICGSSVSEASYKRHLETKLHENRLYNKLCDKITNNGEKPLYTYLDEILRNSAKILTELKSA